MLQNFPFFQAPFPMGLSPPIPAPPNLRDRSDGASPSLGISYLCVMLRSQGGSQERGEGG